MVHRRHRPKPAPRTPLSLGVTLEPRPPNVERDRLLDLLAVADRLAELAGTTPPNPDALREAVEAYWAIRGGAGRP
jgi:hypothetical protein